jgi:CheY-like chemotaxis protein
VTPDTRAEAGPAAVDILLVDDQPEGLLALEAILADLGQNLVKASSGPEALRQVLAREFAAILLDVQMPGMDGFEVAQLIRQLDRARYTPIIFLTAAHRSKDQVFQGYWRARRRR